MLSLPSCKARQSTTTPQNPSAFITCFRRDVVPHGHSQLPLGKATQCLQLTLPPLFLPPAINPLLTACPPQERPDQEQSVLAGVLLFINPNLQKKAKPKPTKQKHLHTLSRSGWRREKRQWFYRTLGARKRPCSALVLCPCYARLRGEEGKERRPDLRHRWHNIADNQQNGPLEEGGGIK